MSPATNDTTAVPTAILLRGRGRKVPPRAVGAFLLGTAGVATLLLVWEVATRAGWVGSSALPTASATFSAIPVLLTTSGFWAALGQTLLSTLIGLLLSIVIALPLGTLIGMNSALHRLLYATIEFLKPIPVAALLPLALLIFGATPTMKLGLIVFGTVWPLLIQVIYGVRAVDAVGWKTARSYRISRLRRFGAVIIPSAAPYIATGVRVAAVTALLLSVVTELVGSVPGLGYELRRAQSAAQFDVLYAYVIIIGIVGLLFNTLLERAEKSIIFWQGANTEGKR